MATISELVKKEAERPPRRKTENIKMSKTISGPYFVVVSDIIFVNADEGGVLYRPKDTMYFGLNPTASFIWDILSKPHTEAEICAALCQNLNVRAERAARDVHVFISDLVANKLVIKVKER